MKVGRLLLSACHALIRREGVVHRVSSLYLRNYILSSEPQHVAVASLQQFPARDPQRYEKAPSWPAPEALPGGSPCGACPSPLCRASSRAYVLSGLLGSCGPWGGELPRGAHRGFLYYFAAKVILFSAECYITFGRKLYYFSPNIILLFSPRAVSQLRPPYPAPR